MFIKKIVINNIKAIERIELSFNRAKRLILLIGHNNSGKTSILEAVKFFFSEDVKGNDLWPLDDSGQYKDLTENDVYVLAEIGLEDLEIEKIKEDLKEPKQDKKIDNCFVNNALIIKKKIRKTKTSIKATEYHIQNSKGQFENITGYVPNTARILPRFMYLPSIANLEDYQSASQRVQHNFEELFELYFEGLKWQEDETIKKLVKDLIQNINSKIKIGEIEKSLKSYSKLLDLGIKDINLNQGFQDVSDLANLIKKVSMIVNDGIKCEAKYKGSGTQRILIFGLLKLIAKQRKLQRIRETIFLIDEPDLHLHPQLQKQIKQIIEKLADNFHTIVASHSHLMIGKHMPEYTLKKVYKEDNIVKDEDIINEEKFFRELFIYLGYIPSDFMLPDNIILVEGKFDKLFFDKVKNMMVEKGEINSGYKKYDISLIDIGGDGQFKKSIKFLQNLPSVINFFQGLPAYSNRFCGCFDSNKSKSLQDLREKADDRTEPHRIIALNKNGIEYYYPKSLLDIYGKQPDDIVKSSEEKQKASNYVCREMSSDYLDEIDEEIKNLINTTFRKAKII